MISNRECVWLRASQRVHERNVLSKANALLFICISPISGYKVIIIPHFPLYMFKFSLHGIICSWKELLN